MKKAVAVRRIVVLNALTVILILGAALSAVAQGHVDPQAIVDQNYPQSLADQLQGTGGNLQRQSCFAIFDTLASGNPRTIMAGYSNGYSGAVRVIQANGSGQYGVIFEPANLNFFGSDCKIQLADLDGDGTNEVIVSFRSIKGNMATWPLQWNGSQLVNLAPDVKVGKKMKSGWFFNMALLDVYHDGTRQVVAGGEYPPPMDGSLPATPSTLYRLQASKFVPVEPLFFSGTYTRSKGQPRTISAWFQLVQGASGPYTLHLTNGDKSGANRVSSARVVLNGNDIVLPQQLNETVESLDVVVNLLANNNIQVTLEGAPGGKIELVVTGTVDSMPQ